MSSRSGTLVLLLAAVLACRCGGKSDAGQDAGAGGGGGNSGGGGTGGLTGSGGGGGATGGGGAMGGGGAGGGVVQRPLPTVPGPGSGPCGCESNESCVITTIQTAQDQTITYSCFVTPAACTTALTCDCVDPCRPGEICGSTLREGTLGCRSPPS